MIVGADAGVRLKRACVDSERRSRSKLWRRRVSRSTLLCILTGGNNSWLGGTHPNTQPPHHKADPDKELTAHQHILPIRIYAPPRPSTTTRPRSQRRVRPCLPCRLLTTARFSGIWRRGAALPGTSRGTCGTRSYLGG